MKQTSYVFIIYNVYHCVDPFTQDKLARCEAHVLIQTNIYISSRAGMPARPDEGIRRGATGDREDPLRVGGEPTGSIVHLEIQ